MLQKMCFKTRPHCYLNGFCVLQHPKISIRSDFLVFCRQQSSSSKILQNKIILIWQTLKHLLEIWKKHVFVAVARENQPVSSKLYILILFSYLTLPWCVHDYYHLIWLYYLSIYSHVLNTRGGWGGGLNSCVGGESEVFSKTNKRGAFNKTRGRRFILHYRQNKKVFPRYSNKSFLTFCKKTAWIIKFCYLMKWNRESILFMIIYNSDFVKLIACSLIIQICRWGLSTKSLSEVNYSIIQKEKSNNNNKTWEKKWEQTWQLQTVSPCKR